jgi:zinc protease
MCNKIFIVLVLLLFFHILVCNNNDLEENLLFDENIIYGHLNNGLTYYIKKNNEPKNTAYLYLVVKAGSLFEDDHQLGLAHFVEHMGFNGTKNFPGHSLSEFVSSTGSQYLSHRNARTSLNSTMYILPARTDNAEYFDKYFMILSDWSNKMTLDNERIDNERSIILEEMRRYASRDRLVRQRNEIIYAGSRYANRLAIGSKEVIEKFEYDSLKDFYNDWYRPDLQAIIAIGDFEVNTVKQLIEKYFDDIPRKENPREHPDLSIPLHEEHRYALIEDDESDENYILVVHKLNSSPTKTVSDYREKFIDTLIVSMLANRLIEISQEPDAPFIEPVVIKDYTMAATVDEFIYVVSVDDTKIIDGFKALAKEIERARQYGFHASELSRAKEKVLKEKEKMYLERNSTRSNVLINDMMYNFIYPEKFPLMNLEYEYLLMKDLSESINLNDIQQSLLKNTSEENKTVIFGGGQDLRVNVPTEIETKEILSLIKIQKLDNYPDTEITIPLLKSLPKKVKVNDPKHNKDLDIYTWTLKNGAIVHLKTTDFKKDEILMEAWRTGGFSQAEDNIFCSARASTDVMMESGIGQFDKKQLNRYLADKDMVLTTEITKFSETISGKSSIRDFETFQQLLYLNFTAHRFDNNAFETWMNKEKTIIKNRDNDPKNYYNTELNRLLYDNNFRANQLNLDDLENVDHREAYNFYISRFNSVDNFIFTFTGNIDKDEMQNYIEKYIASLPGKKVNVNLIDRNLNFNKNQQRKDLYYGQNDACIVTIMFNDDYKYQPGIQIWEQSSYYILNHLLMENIRAKMGGVYSFRIKPLMTYDNQISYQIEFGCSPEAVDDLIEAVLAQVNAVYNGDFDEKYLNNYIETARNGISVWNRENKTWLEFMRKVFAKNILIKDLLLNESHFESLTKDNVANAFSNMVNLDNMLILVLYPQTMEQ